MRKTLVERGFRVITPTLLNATRVLLKRNSGFIHHGELFFESTPGKNIPVIGVFGDVTFSGAGLAGFVGPFHQNGNLVASEVHVMTADKVAVSIGQSNKVRFQVEGELKAELIDMVLLTK